MQLLEFSLYLENYLWPNFSKEASSYEHLLSIVLMVNTKVRESLAAWEFISDLKPALKGKKGEGDEEIKFRSFLEAIVGLHLGFWPAQGNKIELTAAESVAYTYFLINCFQSLEHSVVRSSVLRLVSLPIWTALSPGRLRLELQTYPQLKRHWTHFLAQRQSQSEGLRRDEEEEADEAEQMPQKKTKKEKGKTNAEKPKDESSVHYESLFVPSLVREFLNKVEQTSDKEELEESYLLYLEMFLQFLVDLLSQLPTRRFLRVVLMDMHVLEHCSLSSLSRRDEQGRLFRQLLDMYRFYLGFEINDQTGLPLSEAEMQAQHHSRLYILQRMAFKYYREQLPDFAFASTANLGRPDVLRAHVYQMPIELVLEICKRVHLIPDQFELRDEGMVAFIREVLLSAYTERQSQIQQINELSLLPSERLLWDPNLVPVGNYGGEKVLALPKLNLQFLTFHDYLLRSYNLFRLESAYEIREDLNDSIKRAAPRQNSQGQTIFTGWARMACPIQKFSIVEVTKPNLGEKVPGQVRAEAQINLLPFRGDVRGEWDAMREHDVVFLITVASPVQDTVSGYNALVRDGSIKKEPMRGQTKWMEEDETFPQRYGIVYVRGGEVYEMADEEGNLMNDPSRPEARGHRPKGTVRTLRLLMDPSQYYQDMSKGDEVYETLNLLVRRKPKENNFKAVLETIRTLMNQAAVGKAVPPWMHDIFLGYGSPDAAHYKNMKEKIMEADFNDTFLDASHVLSSFPEAEVKMLFSDGNEIPVSSPDMAGLPPPPYALVFGGKDTKTDSEVVCVKPYTPLNPGPFPQDQPQRNFVRFTPTQIEAIRSGINPGLTLVVGPPGTGKTDVAVQIVANLYRNYPSQRILLVTHSNAALNDLFEKIIQRDIDERHLLRLGAGEKELRVGSGKDFSKWGRVNYSLSRRLQLLGEVERLARSLQVEGDVGYTCETAKYFCLYHIQSRVEEFETACARIKEENKEDEKTVMSLFPFLDFFATAPQPLFKKASFGTDFEIAQGCFRHVFRLFEELEDYRAFELLRSHRQRADYLLTKQAKIVAMTCTHAALNRSNLVKLKFKYDNIVMEECGQILEVETFIPMLLQDHDVVEGCRLKRITLIGDHHQLPPVVKNMAIQKYGKLDQSLFARFIRLNVPSVQLNAQGRSRPQIANLYNWRYNDLGNLENVLLRPEYQLSNAGFLHTFQLVNVPDFDGVGESTPTPHFYQNLGEAEYVVAVYQYMRLLGYPAERISILATYNGQKHLIRDVLNQRCRDPFFGMPLQVTTVDRYQGQQNDYILLSLVRTRAVGHFRDARRLVVAMSRARLGLYIFCRQALFQNCYELTPAFRILQQHSSKLQLLLPENFPSTRLLDGPPAPDVVHKAVEDVTEMGIIVHQIAAQLQEQVFGVQP